LFDKQTELGAIFDLCGELRPVICKTERTLPGWILYQNYHSTLELQKFTVS
jgi:hypothetical protein